MSKILAQLAAEIQIRPDQVKAAVELLDGGATVPFIARYRKEVTGGLDDIQLRELEYPASPKAASRCIWAGATAPERPTT